MKFFISCVLLLFLVALGYTKDCSSNNNKRINSKLICYYSKLSNVDSCYCTHVVLPGNTDLKTIQNIKKKLADNGAKILLTVTEFNQGLIEIVEKNNIDGLEIKLQKVDSKDDITEFISTIRNRLGNDLYIAVSVPARTELLAKYYDLKQLTKTADLFILQTSFLGASRNVTFHPSPLSGLWDMQNTDSVVDLVTGLGAPLSKLAITAPVQAYQFKLQDKRYTTPGSPAIELKSLTRDDLCIKMGSDKNWMLERDQDQSGPYIFREDQWISFEDTMSMDIKAKYARIRGLAGLALKDLSMDGGEKCGGSLLEAAHSGLSKQTRAPRGAVLRSLEREILETPSSLLDTVHLSPYRISRVVDVEGHVHTIRKDTRTEFTCSRQGYFVHPKSCGRFYRCVKFDQQTEEYSVFEFDCPAGLVFDSRWEVCVWPGSLPHGTACSGSSEIAPVPRERFTCPSEPGYYADPENCRWFFACLDHGRSGLTAYEFRCPFGLVYDEKRLLCEWPWLVPSCSSGHYGFELGSLEFHGGIAGSSVDSKTIGVGIVGVGGISGDGNFGTVGIGTGSLTHTSGSLGVGSHTAGGLGVGSYTSGGLGVDSHTSGGLGVSSYTSGGLGVASHTSGSLGVASHTSENLGVASHTSGNLGVGSYTSGSLGGASHTSGGLGVASHTSGSLGVASHTSGSLGDGSYTSGGLGVGSYSSGGLGVGSYSSGGFGAGSHTSGSLGINHGAGVFQAGLQNNVGHILSTYDGLGSLGSLQLDGYHGNLDEFGKLHGFGISGAYDSSNLLTDYHGSSGVLLENGGANLHLVDSGTGHFSSGNQQLTSGGSDGSLHSTSGTGSDGSIISSGGGSDGSIHLTSGGYSSGNLHLTSGAGLHLTSGGNSDGSLQSSSGYSDGSLHSSSGGYSDESLHITSGGSSDGSLHLSSGGNSNGNLHITSGGYSDGSLHSSSGYSDGTLHLSSGGNSDGSLHSSSGYFAGSLQSSSGGYSDGSLHLSSGGSSGGSLHITSGGNTNENLYSVDSGRDHFDSGVNIHLVDSGATKTSSGYSESNLYSGSAQSNQNQFSNNYGSSEYGYNTYLDSSNTKSGKSLSSSDQFSGGAGSSIEYHGSYGRKNTEGSGNVQKINIGTFGSSSNVNQAGKVLLDTNRATDAHYNTHVYNSNYAELNGRVIDIGSRNYDSNIYLGNAYGYGSYQTGGYGSIGGYKSGSTTGLYDKYGKFGEVLQSYGNYGKVTPVGQVHYTIPQSVYYDGNQAKSSQYITQTHTNGYGINQFVRNGSYFGTQNPGLLTEIKYQTPLVQIDKTEFGKGYIGDGKSFQTISFHTKTPVVQQSVYVTPKYDTVQQVFVSPKVESVTQKYQVVTPKIETVSPAIQTYKQGTSYQTVSFQTKTPVVQQSQVYVAPKLETVSVAPVADYGSHGTSYQTVSFETKTPVVQKEKVYVQPKVETVSVAPVQYGNTGYVSFERKTPVVQPQVYVAPKLETVSVTPGYETVHGSGYQSVSYETKPEVYVAPKVETVVPNVQTHYYTKQNTYEGFNAEQGKSFQSVSYETKTPIVQEQVYVQKPVQQQVYVQKPVQQQVYVQKPVQQQVYVQKPVQQQVYVQKPIQEQVYVQQPVQQQVYVQKPVQQQVYVQKPIQEQVYVQQPVQQQVYVQKPVQQQVYVQKPIQEQVYVQQPVQQQVYVQKPIVHEQVTTKVETVTAAPKYETNYESKSYQTVSFEHKVPEVVTPKYYQQEYVQPVSIQTPIVSTTPRYETVTSKVETTYYQTPTVTPIKTVTPIVSETYQYVPQKTVLNIKQESREYLPPQKTETVYVQTSPKPVEYRPKKIQTVTAAPVVYETYSLQPQPEVVNLKSTPLQETVYISSTPKPVQTYQVYNQPKYETYVQTKPVVHQYVAPKVQISSTPKPVEIYQEFTQPKYDTQTYVQTKPKVYVTPKYNVFQEYIQPKVTTKTYVTPRYEYQESITIQSTPKPKGREYYVESKPKLQEYYVESTPKPKLQEYYVESKPKLQEYYVESTPKPKLQEYYVESKPKLQEYYVESSPKPKLQEYYVESKPKLQEYYVESTPKPKLQEYYVESKPKLQEYYVSSTSTPVVQKTIPIVTPKYEIYQEYQQVEYQPQQVKYQPQQVVYQSTPKPKGFYITSTPKYEQKVIVSSPRPFTKQYVSSTPKYNLFEEYVAPKVTPAVISEFKYENNAYKYQQNNKQEYKATTVEQQNNAFEYYEQPSVEITKVKQDDYKQDDYKQDDYKQENYDYKQQNDYKQVNYEYSQQNYDYNQQDTYNYKQPKAYDYKQQETYDYKQQGSYDYKQQESYDYKQKESYDYNNNHQFKFVQDYKVEQPKQEIYYSTSKPKITTEYIPLKTYQTDYIISTPKPTLYTTVAPLIKQTARVPTKVVAINKYIVDTPKPVYISSTTPVLKTVEPVSNLEFYDSKYDILLNTPGTIDEYETSTTVKPIRKKIKTTTENPGVVDLRFSTPTPAPEQYLKETTFDTYNDYDKYVVTTLKPKPTIRPVVIKKKLLTTTPEYISVQTEEAVKKYEDFDAVHIVSTQKPVTLRPVIRKKIVTTAVPYTEEYIVKSTKQPVVITPKPKGKTIVRVNDFHPLLTTKLGAQCTCTSNTVQLRKKSKQISEPVFDYENLPVTKITSDGRTSYDDYSEPGVYVVGNSDNSYDDYELKKVITPRPEVVVSTTNAIQPAPTPVYTIKRKKIVPSTTSATVVDEVIKKSGKSKEEKIAETVKEGLTLVKSAIKGYVKEAIQESSQEFDRYGPGGWRGRDERLQGTVDCQREGLFRHPTQCNKFYACHWDCKKLKYTLHVFNCPIHLTFDSTMGACNWPSKGPACSGNTLLPSV